MRPSPDSSSYYRKMQAADARWTAALKHVQARLRKGERLGVEIKVNEVCDDFNLTSGWNAFMSSYDYSKPVTACRVAAAREEWRRQELIRWVLDHPQEAAARLSQGRSKARRYSQPRRLKESADLPETAEKAARTEEEPVAAPALPQIRLATWGFGDLMRTLWVRWDVEVSAGHWRTADTWHRLHPQEYDYERVTYPGGQTDVLAHYRAGSFKGGRLTDAELERILAEGVEKIRAAFPGKRLEDADVMSRRWVRLHTKS